MKRRLAVLALLAACSGVDPKVAEDRVKKIAEKSLQTPVKSVTCPRAPNRKGSIFECQVVFAEGGEGTMRLEITDGYGNFDPSWVKPIVSRANLGPSIEDQLGKPVDCGTGVIEAPAQLTCGTLAVTLDADGNVTW
jgi:hypothetical protein